MKRFAFGALFALFALALAAPGWAAVRAPQPVDPAGGSDPQTMAAGPLTAAAGIACPGCQVTDFSREILTGRIAHYQFRLRFGPGPYDVLGVHRVVREAAPLVPIRAKDAMLLLHGDLLGFQGAFLANFSSSGAPADHALPVYLAGNDIDVWGIDQGWTLVPADEADSSWAAGWGFDRELSGLNLGIEVARAVRGVTGSGTGKIFILGWSRGAQMVLAHASAQAPLPPGQQNVKGYVYADVWFKFTDPVMKQAACDFYDAEMGRIETGDVLETSGSLFIWMGDLARSAPNGPSPIFEGLTNSTAALFFGSVPFGYTYAPNYHLVAGIFDEAGLPTGLQYTGVPLFFDWLTGASPYEPLQIEADGDAVGCERFDVPWDDHFADITAPILYIEAAGGAGGDFGRQTLAFLPRASVTALRIQLHPDSDRGLDFAHVDLWNADNAQTLVWKPILDWMKRH